MTGEDPSHGRRSPGAVRTRVNATSTDPLSAARTSPHSGTSARRVLQHDSELGHWELVRRAAGPHLRAHVESYYGYTERQPGFSRRRHVPSGDVVLIVNFGSPLLRIDPAPGAAPSQGRGMWMGGLRDRHLLSEATGPLHCLEARFTPIGARRLLGLPMCELTNGILDLEDHLGAIARRLMARLHDAPNWEGRFAILDRFIGERMNASRPVADGVAWAWRALHESNGRVTIGSLAGELGWSRKRMVAAFDDQIGLPPKLLARVLRFGQVVRALDHSDAVSWAAVADASGYFDQAHLIKDFRAFAGCTPREFLRHRLPELGSARA